MNLRKLSELFQKPMSGEWGVASKDGSGVKVLRTTNFSANGRVNLEKGVAVRSIEDRKVQMKRLAVGDLIVEKSGGSDTQSVGRVVFFDLEDGDYLCNNFTAVLRPREGNHPRYLLYLLLHLYGRGEVLRYQNKTTGIINLKLQSYLDDTLVEVPPFETQKRLAAALDQAQELIDKRQQQIDLLDEFLESVFLDMFGDPVANPRGWEEVRMGDLGDLKNGINYTQDDNGYRLKCLGVGNFRDLHEITDIDALVDVELSQEPSRGYLLEAGDLVFVRSNGNRALVGRSVAVFPRGTEVTFSGFCIRFRAHDKETLPRYLNYVFHLPSFRSWLLHKMRGANIQNVNQQILSSLELPLPPVKLLSEFVDAIGLVGKRRADLERSTVELQELFNSIMQKAFRGELFT